MTEKYPFSFSIESYLRETSPGPIDAPMLQILTSSRTHQQLLNRLYAETQIRGSRFLATMQGTLRAQFIRSMLLDTLCFSDPAEHLVQTPAFLLSNYPISKILGFLQYIYRIGLLKTLNLKPFFMKFNVDALLNSTNSDEHQELTFEEPTPFYALLQLQPLFEALQDEIVRYLTHQVGGNLEQIMENDFQRAFTKLASGVKNRPVGEFSVARYFEVWEPFDPTACNELCVICFDLTEVELVRFRFIVSAIRVLASFYYEMALLECENVRYRVLLFLIRQLLHKMLSYFELVCAYKCGINNAFSQLFAQTYQQKHFVRLCDLLVRARWPGTIYQMVMLRAELECTVEDFRRAGIECGCQSWL